ncbi:MAG: DUF2442 domain-containing protein [Fibromonadaceae bacterium]|nr:DUF2442 domain-containing protein [Fibromonadaceae bacterium]
MVLVDSVKALPDYKLLVGFNTGEEKIFDFSKYLSLPIFSKLKNPVLFNKAFADGTTVVWDDDTDIAPERLYSDSVSVSC